ncbi:hypothetical protein EJP02_206 [Escherichia phage EJP2]|nr:hypothetical protein EJP02_206 [Escherichia phage EJP2]
MNNLQKILTDSLPVLEYRIKFAVEPSKEDLSKIHNRLNDRYDAIEISPLMKSIFQTRPLEFYELDCGEIWWLDFKCNRGVQPEVLLYEIGNMLKWSEALLRVRGKYEPIEIEDVLDDSEELDFDEIEPVIGQPFGEPFEPEAQDIAGQQRADDAVKNAKERLGRSQYSNYMSAGYGKKG